MAKAAIKGVGEAIEGMRKELDAMVQTQASAVAALSQQVQQGVDLASKHNAALEDEISKSRQNVAKVHTALVEMTESLAARAEARV